MGDVDEPSSAVALQQEHHVGQHHHRAHPGTGPLARETLPDRCPP